MSKFSIAALPDLSGKTALVTGANSGLGIETAKALAAKGARVIMACRNEEKANKAASIIRDQVPNAALTIRKLDLGDLASVNRFTDEILGEENEITVMCEFCLQQFIFNQFDLKANQAIQGNKTQH